MGDTLEAAARRSRRLRLALAINLAIVVVQVLAGFSANSLGLLADAGHNLADVAAVALSLVAVRLSTRRPTAERTFGHHRWTVLAAQANAGLVLAASAVIVYEALRRLLHPVKVDGGVVLVVALLAFAANAAAARAVAHDRDLNMRGALLHLVGDALASLGVAAAGAVMLATGGAAWLDPVVSLVIATLMAAEAVLLLRETTDVLLESTPGGLDMGRVAQVMERVQGVEEVHDLHAWSLSTDVRALSAHVVMTGHPTLEEAQQVADEVKRAVAGPFGISHATLELECETCAPGDADPCAMEGLIRADGPDQRHRH